MTKPIMFGTINGPRPTKYQPGQHIVGRVVAGQNLQADTLVSGVIQLGNTPYKLETGRVVIELDPDCRNGITVTAWVEVTPGVTVINIDTLNTPETVTRTLPVADNTIRPLPSLVVKRDLPSTDEILADEQKGDEQKITTVDIDKLLEEVKKYPSPNPQLVQFYEMGRKGIVPFQWKKFADQLDPEYAEYLRLQKKFS